MGRRGTHRGHEDREKWGPPMAGHTLRRGGGAGGARWLLRGHGGRGRGGRAGGGAGPLWRAGQRAGPAAVPEGPRRRSRA